MMRWRAMAAGDIDAVVAVARTAFPDHPEQRGCFVERLALAPASCFVLEGTDGIAGYLIAYPWPRGAIPPLDSLLHRLPDMHDHWYLHDLALHPDARGGGHARTGLGLLLAQVSAPIALVSVNASAGFWQRHGFVVQDDPVLRLKLASYGPDARYMVRAPDATE